MKLTRVTLTGADDSTSIPELLDLSTEFPWVEWGILVSLRQQGGQRFPSRGWCSEFAIAVSRTSLPVHVSTHVCGLWVRKMLTGDLAWPDLPRCLEVSERIQINTHAEPHISTTGLMRSLKRISASWGEEPQFIFQWDGVNDHLTHAARGYGFDAAALFDTSGGAGVLPDHWPEPIPDIPCGYAGGLGPDNVAAMIAKIAFRVTDSEAIGKKTFWIDMERRVRTDDDSALDMKKVRAVLERCKEFVRV